MTEVMFYESKVQRVVSVPREYLWKRLIAFDEIKSLLPESIIKVKLPNKFSNKIGDVRYVYLGDPYPGEVIERLDGYEDGLSLTYSILDKSCLPISNYVAFVSLNELSKDNTEVLWCGHFIKNLDKEVDATELLESLYNLILDNIENQYKNSHI